LRDDAVDCSSHDRRDRPVPNGDLATTNFAFGGPDNRDIFPEGAISGTFWRFKAPNPGLIGPGGARLPAQP
jgi:gluconolactonase